MSTKFYLMEIYKELYPFKRDAHNNELLIAKRYVGGDFTLAMNISELFVLISKLPIGILVIEDEYSDQYSKKSFLSELDLVTKLNINKAGDWF